MKADIACTDLDCTGIMTHVSGATFECDTCGQDWAPHWWVIESLDRLACLREGDDAVAVADAIRIATGQVAGENEPAADDLPAMLGVPDLPTAVVIAWAAWRAEYERCLDEVA